jgi:hypothetical protein
LAFFGVRASWNVIVGGAFSAALGMVAMLDFLLRVGVPRVVVSSAFENFDVLKSRRIPSLAVRRRGGPRSG